MEGSTGVFFNVYAVFQSGGKQYRAYKGQIIRLEKLNNDIGEMIEFKKVLMVKNAEDVKIGAPLVLSATIKGEIINHGRADKINIIKFRRRKHYRKKAGHRQWFTDVKIISLGI